MRAKLTKRFVEALQPRERPYEARDIEFKRLVVRVERTGHKTFWLRYPFAGKRSNRFKLGVFPGVSVEGARALAEAANGDVARGLDPQARRKAERVDAERAKVSTLGTFIDGRYAPWALQHLRRGDVAVARLKADFAKWLDESLTNFNNWRIESWRKDRLKAGIKPVTLNRQLDTLRSCLHKAVEWRVIDKHPMQGLKWLDVDDDERVRYLTSEEEQRLRGALVKRDDDMRTARDRFNEWREARHKPALPRRPEGFVDHIRPLVLTAINTGLRRGELFSLRWSDVDFVGHMLTVRAAAAKSGDSRRVPLNAEVQEVLEAWRKQGDAKNEDLVFPGAERAKLTRLDKSWATVCKLAELTDFRFHDCRHHFASRLVQLGTDLNMIRALLGHSDLKMTLRYSHLAPDNLHTAVARLGAS
jgi:integrase